MTPRKGTWGDLLALRCPACGRGAFWQGGFRTARSCPACGMLFEKEAGYYAGAIYPAYFLGALLGALIFGSLYLLGAKVWVAALAVLLGVGLASPLLIAYGRLMFLNADRRFFGEEG